MVRRRGFYTASECDPVALWASTERGEQYRNQVPLEYSDIVEDPCYCPVVILLVHSPESLQILEAPCVPDHQQSALP